MDSTAWRTANPAIIDLVPDVWPDSPLNMAGSIDPENFGGDSEYFPYRQVQFSTRSIAEHYNFHVPSALLRFSANLNENSNEAGDPMIYSAIYADQDSRYSVILLELALSGSWHLYVEPIVTGRSMEWAWYINESTYAPQRILGISAVSENNNVIVDHITSSSTAALFQSPVVRASQTQFGTVKAWIDSSGYLNINTQ